MLSEIVIPLISRVRPVSRAIMTKMNVLWKMISAYKYQTFLRKFQKVLDNRYLSLLIENEESIWDDVKEKLEEVRSLLQSSTKTEINIALLPSLKESNKRKSNTKYNPLTERKKGKTEKNRVSVAKEKNKFSINY